MALDWSAGNQMGRPMISSGHQEADMMMMMNKSYVLAPFKQLQVFRIKLDTPGP